MLRHEVSDASLWLALANTTTAHSPRPAGFCKFTRIESAHIAEADNANLHGALLRHCVENPRTNKRNNRVCACLASTLLVRHSRSFYPQEDTAVAYQHTMHVD